MLYVGPRTKLTDVDDFTDSEQLQIMEAYAESQDNLFLDWSDDDYLFEPEE